MEQGLLVDAYPDSEFKNLTRSTVVLMAYWRDQNARLRQLADSLGAPDLCEAVVTPEFPTPSASGKASFTDLLVETSATAVAIEAKRNEGRYDTVAKWCDSENKRRVLNHWLTHIRRRAVVPESAQLEQLVYQMIHRTASACARPTERAVVLYQMFGTKHLAEYEADLRALAVAIQPEPQLEIWMHVVSVAPSTDYPVIEREMAELLEAERPAMLRHALKQRELFLFDDTRFTRIA